MSTYHVLMDHRDLSLLTPDELRQLIRELDDQADDIKRRRVLASEALDRKLTAQIPKPGAEK
jgi:hypothetical protein